MKIVASDGEYVDQETTYVIDVNGAGFALFARGNRAIYIVDDPNSFVRFIPELEEVGIDFPFDNDPEMAASVLAEFENALGVVELLDWRRKTKEAREKEDQARYAKEKENEVRAKR